MEKSTKGNSFRATFEFAESGDYKPFLLDLTGDGDKRYLILTEWSGGNNAFGYRGYLIDTKDNFSILGEVPAGEIYDYTLDNKGFVFIETIITVVVLMATLLLMYSSFSKVIINEQNRLYHDDISYVYKTKHIADVLKLSIDTYKFDNQLKSNLCSENGNAIGCKYVYIFNIESDIYSNNSLITKAHELYDFYRLVYIKVDDIRDLKKCLDDTNSTDPKCQTSQSFIKAHGYNQLYNYLTTLDVDKVKDEDNKDIEGILVALFYEAKNGEVKNDNNVVSIGIGKYSECTLKKALGYYYNKDDGNDAEKKSAMDQYEADDQLSFDMACQNAYYISWVYL